MSVVPIKANLAPAETEIEREAVGGVLNTIRAMQSDTGIASDGVFWVAVGSKEDQTALKTGWINLSGQTRARLALSALALSEEVMGRK